MNNRDPFRIFMLFLWVTMIVSDIIELVEAYSLLGMSMFSTYEYYFMIAFVLLRIAMCITLFTNRIKYFIYFFTADVVLESGLCIADFAYGVNAGLMNSILEINNIKLTLYYVFSFYVSTLVITVYAGLLLAAVIMFVFRIRKRYKIANFAIDCGYVVAAVNVVLTILSFINMTEGFEFLEIAYNLLTTVFFSIIYITIPRYLFYVFD